MSFTAKDIVDLEFSLAIAKVRHLLTSEKKADRRKQMERRVQRLELGLRAYVRTLGQKYSMELDKDPSWYPEELLSKALDMGIEDALSEADDSIALCRA